MSERLAEAADKDDAKAFDRIRSRFIQACAHLDQGARHRRCRRATGPLLFDVMEATVSARRDGRPDPFPWLPLFACALMDEEQGTRERPVEPTLN